MKKIVLLLVLLLTLVFLCLGCKDPHKQLHKEININKLTIVTIDSCEYFECNVRGGRRVFTHKGNCKFCEERRKQEIKYLIRQLH